MNTAFDVETIKSLDRGGASSMCALTFSFFSSSSSSLLKSRESGSNDLISESARGDWTTYVVARGRVHHLLAIDDLREDVSPRGRHFRDNRERSEGVLSIRFKSNQLSVRFNHEEAFHQKRRNVSDGR